MTIDEWRIEAKHLKTMYPNDKFMPKEEYVDVWYSYLSDIDYVYVKMAVKTWVAGNSFYPTVGDIRREAFEAKEEARQKLNELKAIYRTCHAYYPLNLIADNDWQYFKDCIRSEQFEDAKTKALRIKSEIMNDCNITMPFREYIDEISRTKCD